MTKSVQKTGEYIGKDCFVCGKKLYRPAPDSKDELTWVYHESKGAACISHPGVLEWWNELYEADSK